MKQEIAKEGVLPFSIFFATSSATPYAWIKERIWPSSRQPGSERPAAEESPAAALLLHWFFSVLLVGCTAANDPSVAYTVLVALYSYTLVIVVGFLVAAGLLYLKLSKREEWNANAGFSPWGGPTAAIIYWFVFIPVESFYHQQNRLTVFSPVSSVLSSSSEPFFPRVPDRRSHTKQRTFGGTLCQPSV